MNKNLFIGPNAPLNTLDNENETYGCRAFNSDMCKNCLSSFCAFVRGDNLCKSPPKGWKKRYKALRDNIQK